LGTLGLNPKSIRFRVARGPALRLWLTATPTCPAAARVAPQRELQRLASARLLMV
jgi:hypothetical protein